MSNQNTNLKRLIIKSFREIMGNIGLKKKKIEINLFVNKVQITLIHKFKYIYIYYLNKYLLYLYYILLKF